MSLDAQDPTSQSYINGGVSGVPPGDQNYNPFCSPRSNYYYPQNQTSFDAQEVANSTHHKNDSIARYAEQSYYYQGNRATPANQYQYPYAQGYKSVDQQPVRKSVDQVSSQYAASYASSSNQSQSSYQSGSFNQSSYGSFHPTQSSQTFPSSGVTKTSPQVSPGVAQTHSPRGHSYNHLSQSRSNFTSPDRSQSGSERPSQESHSIANNQYSQYQNFRDFSDYSNKEVTLPKHTSEQPQKSYSVHSQEDSKPTIQQVVPQKEQLTDPEFEQNSIETHSESALSISGDVKPMLPQVISSPASTQPEPIVIKPNPDLDPELLQEQPDPDQTPMLPSEPAVTTSGEPEQQHSPTETRSTLSMKESIHSKIDMIADRNYDSEHENAESGSNHGGMPSQSRGFEFDGPTPSFDDLKQSLDPDGPMVGLVARRSSSHDQRVIEPPPSPDQSRYNQSRFADSPIKRDQLYTHEPEPSSPSPYSRFDYPPQDSSTPSFPGNDRSRMRNPETSEATDLSTGTKGIDTSSSSSRDYDTKSPASSTGSAPRSSSAHAYASSSPLHSPYSTPLPPSGTSPGSMAGMHHMAALSAMSASLSPGSMMGMATPTRTCGSGGKLDVYYCHLCTYVGQNKDDFDMHMGTHFEHQCPNCDYTSRTEGRLKRHIKDFHMDEDGNEEGSVGYKREVGKPKVFRCRQCNYVTTEKVEFWDHARHHIKDDKLLQCPKCPFVTEYKHHLEYHLRNHFGSKPYKCPKCNYACVNKSMLNSHMKSHTNVYQYRCADCTYATKYCHSLKLHLKKYCHKPATVLNPDGSLPTDGSGDFELVSKRGPPRGPRGPRRERSPPPPGFPGAGLPLPPALAAAASQGQLGSGFWPMPGNGLTAPPPLIPVSGMMNPLGLQLPGLKCLEQQGREPKASPQGKKCTSQNSPGESGSKIKCAFCPTPCESRQHLLFHMMKEHPMDTQQLFGMMGVPPEVLLHEEFPLPGSQLPLPWDKSPVPIPMEMTHMWAMMAAAAARGLPPPHMLPNIPGGSPHGTPNHHRRDNASPDEQHQDHMFIVKSEAQQNGETPLDLTKADQVQHHHNSVDGSRRGSGSSFKRSYPEEDEEKSPIETISHDASGVGAGSPTPRKRSRKGKAYKLDTLCLKLQERQTSPVDDGDYDSNEEYEYSGANDRMSSQNHGEMMRRPSDDEGSEPNTKENQSADNPVNYHEIHSSLQELNKAGKGPVNGEGITGDNITPEGITSQIPAEEQKLPAFDPASVFSGSINRKKMMMVSRRLEPHFDNSLKNGKWPLAEKTDEGHNMEKDINQSKSEQRNKVSPKYECVHCDIAFKDCIMYTMHMGYHGYKDPFKCNMCGHPAQDKVEFFLHIARAAHE